jgi:rhodanese-related sulfurtransferase
MSSFQQPSAVLAEQQRTRILKNSQPFLVPCEAKDLFNFPLSELPIILDIRSEEEFQQSHLLGAISFPLRDTEGVHEVGKEDVEKALLETVLLTFHQPHNLPPGVENLKGPKTSSLPSLAGQCDNNWVVGCNGGYPDLFRTLFVFCDPEQIDFTSFNFLITILQERGFPTFYEEENESESSTTSMNTSGVYWNVISQVKVLDSFIPFQVAFPFLITQNHSLRYASDTPYGRSLVAQERSLHVVMNDDEFISKISLTEKEMFFPSLIEDWGLYLGSNINAGDLRVLTTLEISSVINITIECPNHFATEFEKHDRALPGRLMELQHTLPESYLASPIRYKRFPAVDTIRQEMLDYWEEGSAIIQQCFVEKKKILVHCAMGKSRSASLVAYYLMKYKHLSLDEALSHLKKCRSQVSINTGFIRQLQEVDGKYYVLEIIDEK